MTELCVRGNTNYFRAQFSKFGILCGQIGQFGWAHKREIRRIKHEDRPFAIFFQFPKVYFTKGAGGWLVGFHFEFGYVLTYAQRGQVIICFVIECV